MTVYADRQDGRRSSGVCQVVANAVRQLLESCTGQKKKKNGRFMMTGKCAGCSWQAVHAGKEGRWGRRKSGKKVRSKARTRLFIAGIQVSHITEGYAGVTIRKTETLVATT